MKLRRELHMVIKAQNNCIAFIHDGVVEQNSVPFPPRAREISIYGLPQEI